MKYLLTPTWLFVLSLTSCSQNQSGREKESSYQRVQAGPVTFQIPNQWKSTDLSTAKSAQGVKDLYAFQNTCGKDAAFCENVVIRFSSAGNEVPLPELGKALLETLPARFEKMKVLRLQDTVVNHIPMEIIEYGFTRQQLDLC